jgi:DNA polymerase III subunit delta'
MDWQHLIGHERQRQWFAHALEQGRLGSTFLFVGPAGIGKRTFALLLTKTLFCQKVAPQEFAPCGQCSGCVQVEAQTHPDLLQVRKPPDKSGLSIELVAGERESRMQEGLCHDIHMSPQDASRRIAIIDDADYLTVEAANAMLKTLEEPPPTAMIMLIGTSPQRQLPTIRSRCQIVRFDPPSPEQAIALLAARGYTANADQLRLALELAGGDLLEAQRMLDPDACAYREQLTAALATEVPEAISLTRSVIAYVDAAGSEASAKRDRARETILVSIAEYRRQLRQRIAAHDSVDEPLTRLERCMQALTQLDRNANTTTLIESWATDLQRAVLFE